MFAQIDSSGRVCASTSLKVLTLMPEGILQIEVPKELRDVVGTHKYNFVTQQFESLPESIEGND